MSVVSNLAPVPSETPACANCGAPLVADQRYCLTCGQPCAPVRLAFLDVLESQRQLGPEAGLAGAAPVAYAPYLEPAAGPAWLRRYAPLFAVLSVLLLALIVGLLVGHWVTQDKGSSGPQVVKIEGLTSAPAASTSAAPSTTTAAAAPAHKAKAAASAKAEEESEAAEARAEEREEAKHPAKAPPAKNETSAVSKLEHTTGKQHEQELSKLSTAPIEVK